MKKIKLLALACTLSLTIVPSFSSEAHIYDYAEVSRAVESPDEYTGLINKDQINAMKSYNQEEAIVLYVIMNNLNDALTYKVKKYEDNNIKIDGELQYMPIYIDKQADYPSNYIRITNAKLPGLDSKKQDVVFMTTGVNLEITNKTTEVMEIDFSKSFIGINNESAPLYDNKDSIYKQTNKDLLHPRIIAPNDCLKENIKINLFVMKKSKFYPRYYLLTGSETMGECKILVNNKELTFPLSAIVDEAKLRFKYNE